MSDLTPERRLEIQAVLQELSDYWHEKPELRLGQIVGNIAEGIRLKDNDPYYIRDDQMHSALVKANKEAITDGDLSE